MKQSIVIAGFGGQGVLFFGKTLAYQGMDLGKNISWLPSYGPEMRGGTANCTIIISDAPIGSPITSKPDVLIAMNKPSLEKFESKVKPGGLIIVDNFLIDKKVERDDVETIYIPAMKIANELGTENLGNMVMAGAYLKAQDYAKLEDLEKSVKAHTPASKEKLLEQNIKMIKAGYDYQVC